MCEILELLAAALSNFPGLQPILLLDTAIGHIGDAVMAKAAELNIGLAPVPAGLTHLLQSLDTAIAQSVHGAAFYRQWHASN